jgi:aminopeptidase N
VDQLTVDSVRYHGANTTFTRPGNHILQINFPSLRLSGSRDSVTIYYGGTPPVSGFGSFTQSSHSGVPILWTLSEPYGSRDWWPCRNGLDDKADSIDAIITTPDAYFASFNGVMQSDVTANGKRTVWWKHRYPIVSYLVALAATNYQILEDTIHLKSRILPFQQYDYPEAAHVWTSAVPATREIARLFEEKLGPYPFQNERYAHTQVGFGGGMEHQTNSWMGNADPGLIAHELAHQWFGNKVTCGSWQHIWVNEGFAVFLNFLYVEKIWPKQDVLTLYQNTINYIAELKGGSVFVTDTANASRIFDYRYSYLKGNWVLQMLRWKLGEEKFYEGLRAYLNDPALKYGFAKTEDLQRNLEQVSGMQLTEFFKDWVYGEGYPSYQLSWMPLGSTKAQVTLRQTTSHPSVNFFEMPVPVMLRNGSRDTVVTFNHLRSGQVETFDVGFTPDTVIIDPDLKLLSAQNVVTRADQFTADNTIKVYPNPVGDQFSISLTKFSQPSASVTIHNAAGQLMYKKLLELPAGNDLLNIPSASWSSGMYVIRISSNGFNHVQRIIK